MMYTKLLREQGKRNMIGAHVAQARAQRGITREVLLEELKREEVEMSVSSLMRPERQKRRVRDYELLALSRALHVSVDWLMRWDK